MTQMTDRILTETNHDHSDWFFVNQTFPTSMCFLILWLVLGGKAAKYYFIVISILLF
jgi:hypothetical protein